MNHHPTRIGLFGGTFDPPHLGHIVIARAAANMAGLSAVLWAPVGRQPLKQHGSLASFDDRMDMARLACLEDERFKVTELDRPNSDGSANYTIDLLQRLQQHYPQAEIWNIVGADSARDLPRWKDPERLVQMAKWFVVSRPDVPMEQMRKALEFFPQDRVMPIFDVAEDISSTNIRSRLQQGEDVSKDIPPSVLRYIEEHNLYR